MRQSFKCEKEKKIFLDKQKWRGFVISRLTLQKNVSRNSSEIRKITGKTLGST